MSWTDVSGLMFLLAGACALTFLAAPVARAGEPAAAGPRKVIVGTTIHSIWQSWPGLDARLEQLGALIDEMAVEAQASYDGTLDLAVLTEYAVTAGRPGDAADQALPLEGPVLDYFAAKAREHGTYIIVPMILAEDRERELFTNAAALVDRQGELVGIYRKVHAVAAAGDAVLEGGVTPGREHTVFETDFGRLGIQICYDMGYDDGWNALAEAGAEIVAWPSASPQTVMPAMRAMRGRCYVVSSTPRNNAAVFDPTGQVAAQIEPPAGTLVTQIDLAYELLHWQPKLHNGRVFDEAFGDRAGYRYSEREDGGIFWSNDPDKPIAEMVEQLGLESAAAGYERNRRLRERVLEAAPVVEDAAP